MTNIVPGAIWQPIDVGKPGDRAARKKGRGAVGHVAVSGAKNLPATTPLAVRGGDWHFYLPKLPNPDGTVRFFQYIDLDLQCWASSAGNRTLPAWESEGGLGTTAQVNAEPWTENQLQAAAIIYAHLVRTEGAPLQVMPDSRPTSRGLGAHRFGIDPWRVPGGEVWSSSAGKTCPGTAKVAQLPEIVARARKLLTPIPAPVQEDDMHFVMKVIGTKATYWVGAGFCVPVQGATLEKNLKDGGATVIEVTPQFIADLRAQVAPATPPAA